MFAIIKKQSQNSQAVSQAQAMLLTCGYTINIDGNFNDAMEDVVKTFQLQNRLVSDGIIGEKTWQLLVQKSVTDYLPVVTSRFLSEDDLVKVATRLNIEVATIKAVNSVESRGSGFLNDFPVILFERHVFWKRLQTYGLDPAALAVGNEDILNVQWGGYKGGVAEVRRLERAKAIHPEAAMESASWGAFQIMGYHWKKLGYNSIADFVERMMKCEAEHLEAFARFIVETNCVKALRPPKGAANGLGLDNFAQFARAYNGSDYERNNYHVKMYKAYLKYRKDTQGTPVQFSQAA